MESMSDSEAIDDWFVREVLPLEASLVGYLRRNSNNEADLLDLRQEVYVRVYDSARKALPDAARPFVFAVARNLLIDRARKARVVSIEFVPELDSMHVSDGPLTPEHYAFARDDLRRFAAGLSNLPERCREVVRLRKVEGLTQREVAWRLGISEDTVERQIRYGMRALADYMTGGPGRIARPRPAPKRKVGL
jgi:RNA polymerase sigma factor (sigma-70 family)